MAGQALTGGDADGARADHPQFIALALQTRCVAINGFDVETARATMARSIDRIGRQLAAAKALLGPDLRLAVLPEYVLTGFPMGQPLDRWAAMAALHPEGAEIGALRRIAVDNALFLSVNAYEADPAFAPLYFQASLVFDPGGGIVLRHHRLISLYAPTPVDVWDLYLDRHGLDSVVPVAETVIGRLAAIASEEILYPEIARLGALRGAEIFVHNSGEMTGPEPTPKAICRRARAVENLAFVVSANAASLETGDLPAATTDGGSAIVDPRGMIIAAAGQGETVAAHAEIDLAALRRQRTRPGMGAMLARIPAETIAALYASLPVQRANALLDARGGIVLPDRGWLLARQAGIIATLVEARRLRCPYKDDPVR